MTRLRSEIVPIERVRPNAWNPNVMSDEMFRKELASIRKFGYVVPVIVYEVGDWYDIVDGENRWKAMRQLGYKELAVTVIEGLTDAAAKQLTIVLNETRGRPDPRKLGALLGDLLGEVSKSDLLDILPIAPMQFDKLTGLEDFDWGSLSDPPAGPAALSPGGPSWVERTYRLPRDAALVIDEALEKARDGDEGIQDWQALEMVAADFLAGATMSATPRRERTDRA